MEFTVTLKSFRQEFWNFRRATQSVTYRGVTYNREVACTRMYFVTEMQILPQDRHYIDHFLSEMESGELQKNYHGIPIYIVFLAQQHENFLGPTF